MSFDKNKKFKYLVAISKMGESASYKDMSVQDILNSMTATTPSERFFIVKYVYLQKDDYSIDTLIWKNIEL